MKALLHISGSPEWPKTLNAPPWPLLPIGNRPLLEYWFELCVDLGIEDVQIVMNDFASEIEAYAESGARWGLKIQYGFEKDGVDPTAHLRRSPSKWENGLLHIRGPVFPVRTEAYCADALKALSGLLVDQDGSRLMIARSKEDVSAYLDGTLKDIRTDLSGLAPSVLSSASDFFRLTQNMVEGESQRYLTSGYQITSDKCLIGANTVIPPTAKILPPVMIGDNCRVSELTTIGPNAVIGNYVVIDQKTEMDNCIILDGSYIGQNMEIRNKIISGSHLYDAENEIGLNIPDPWLLGSTTPAKRSDESLRAITGWLIALPTAMLMVVPYAVLSILPRVTRNALERVNLHGINGKELRYKVIKTPANPGVLFELFHGLSLDIFPHVLRVLTGKLWLCGHSALLQKENEELKNELPVYFPAVICYEDAQSKSDVTPAAIRANSFYYIEARSPLEDLRLFFRFIIYRLNFLWAE